MLYLLTLDVVSNSPRTNRRTIQLLPTPESPNRTNCIHVNPKVSSLPCAKIQHSFSLVLSAMERKKVEGYHPSLTNIMFSEM